MTLPHIWLFNAWLKFFFYSYGENFKSPSVDSAKLVPLVSQNKLERWFPGKNLQASLILGVRYGANP